MGTLSKKCETQGLFEQNSPGVFLVAYFKILEVSDITLETAIYDNDVCISGIAPWESFISYLENSNNGFSTGADPLES